jgi:catechol 2,3-dioxygenase-like lactoylglutathione lyase family enzyme
MDFVIRRIDHVVLRVASLAPALHFYCEVLGLREERRIDALGLVQLRAGESLLDLVDVDSPLGRHGGAAPGASGRNLDHLALRIDPFAPELLRGWLEAHGVKAGEVGERYGAEGTGPSLYVSDPDGNVVELKGPATAPARRPPEAP